MQARRRVVDALLDERLASSSVVVLEGPRGAGVSTAAQRHAGHVWRTGSDDYATQFVDMAPKILFGERSPVLFDEWDATPQLLDRAVDAVRAGQLGQSRLILAGARTPREAELRATEDGQVAWVRMRPLSLWESGHSTGAVSLDALLAGEGVTEDEPELDAHQLFERIVVGGWPAVQAMGETRARRWLRDHLLHLVRTELPGQGVRRTEDDLRRLMAALASGVGSEQKLAHVARRVASPGAVAPRAETVADYLAALRRLHLLEDVTAWTPALTSAAALRRTPRRYFTDPSIALASLGLGTDALRRDLSLAATHFGALVARDLRTYADVHDGQVLHVRDNNGRTVDLVVVLPDGTWGAIAVRMNPAGADDGAAQVKWLASKVDVRVTDQRPPAFLAVVTGAGSAHTREDGVHVVPVASLAP